MAFNLWSCLDFQPCTSRRPPLKCESPAGTSPVEGRARRRCLHFCGRRSLQTEDCLSMHSAFCGLRDRWHTLLVQAAIIGTKCWGRGHRSEIYGIFTFFLIHCPANTAITAAASPRPLKCSGDEKRPPRREAAPGESEDDLWKKTQHLSGCTPTAWQDAHIFFCVVIWPFKGAVHQRF